MNDDFSFDESELSAEDLEILRAFDAIESWDADPSTPDTAAVEHHDVPGGLSDEGHASSDEEEPDDMLAVFLPEVEEDIAGLQQALKQLEQEQYSRPAHFVALQRLGHKIRGSSAAIGYMKMSEIASHVEIIAEQTVHHMIATASAAKAVTHATAVLQFSLHRVTQSKKDIVDDLLISNLLALYASLSIDLEQPISEHVPGSPSAVEEMNTNTTPAASAEVEQPVIKAVVVEEHAGAPKMRSWDMALSLTEPSLQFDMHHFDTLIQHSEKLFAQQVSINHAYKQMESALQDFQAAQARLQSVETLFSTSLTQERLSQIPAGLTSSSLIKRILQNAATRDGSRPRKSKVSKPRLQAPEQWDELDIERYSEKDLLLHKLREAIANMASCSARLKAAHHTLNTLQQEYMQHMVLVRDDTLRLRMVPLRTMISQIQEVVTTSILAQERQVDIEVRGADIEVDKSVLSSLSPLLVQMVRNCIDTVVMSEKEPSGLSMADQVWLRARVVHNEVALDIGFSMPVGGGTLQTVREHLRELYGSLSLTRNEAGGISFSLRFPRVKGMLQCLHVSVADQHLLLPLSHVHSVSYKTHESTDLSYDLGALLGMPPAYVLNTSVQPAVFVEPSEVYTCSKPLRILVDEIIDDVELMVKPLAPHLQRPGVMGTASDGAGNVLLVLDVAELVNRHEQELARPRKAAAQAASDDVQQTTAPVRVLIADDSAYLRRSVLQSLKHTPYQVIEAENGLDTLDRLKEQAPDVLLLDIEMPFLNGLDLLHIVRDNARLSSMKIIMLTSRSSHKHIERAMELGAHDYLTKPTSGEKLLASIQKLLPIQATEPPSVE